MSDQKHIISKLTVEVECRDEANAYFIKDNTDAFIQKHVLSELERYFAALEQQIGKEEFLQIDQLSIEVNTSSKDLTGREFQMDLAQVMDAHVAETLQKMRTDTFGRTNLIIAKNEGGTSFNGEKNHRNATRNEQNFLNERSVFNAESVDNLPKTWIKQTLQEKELEAWYYFIQTGKRPWWASSTEDFNSFLKEEVLREQLGKNATNNLENLRRLVANPISRQRLIRQYSFPFLVDFCTFLIQKEASVFANPSKNNKRAIIENKLRQISGGNTLLFVLWDLIFEVISAPTTSEKNLQEQVMEQFITKISSVSPSFAAEKSGTFLETILEFLKSVFGSKSVSTVTIEKWGIELQAKKHHRSTPPEELGNVKNALAENKSEKTANSIGKTDEIKHSEETAKNMEVSFTPDETETKDKAVDLKTEDNTENSEDRLSENPVNQLSENPAKKEEAMFPVSEDEKQSFQKTNKSDAKSDSLEAKKGKDKLRKDISKDEKQNQTLRTQEKTPEISADSKFVSKENQDEESVSSFSLSSDPEKIEKSVEGSSEKSDPSSFLSKGEEENFRSNEKGNHPKTNRNVADVLFQETKMPQSADFQDGNQVLVDNAGLVILHPFLKHFFGKTGQLTEAKKLADPELAAHLLHYIATGKENDFEHTMLFEKFLVGLPITCPLERNIELRAEWKAEAMELLNAAKNNWQPLKNSSLETLQETFLQRSGKLMDDYPQPRLLVERKTLDILMNKLDWNISIVKLPWMDKILFVEW